MQLARGVTRAWRLGRAFDLVHTHGEVASGLCLPLLLARPSVVTLNGLHLVRRLSGLRRKAAELNLRAAIRAADRMICVSRAERDYLRAAVGRAAENRVVVIHNGVPIPTPPPPIDRARVRAELGLNPAEPVAIWVGSLDERKNPLAAIRAAREASVSLLVVGDGPLRMNVEEAATARVHVLGQRTDVNELLAAADLFVLTSHREGLSFALLEAMALGLVPMVADVPENREAIGEAGIVFADSATLATALRRIVARPDERRALAARAAQRVAGLFERDGMVARTHAVYANVA